MNYIDLFAGAGGFSKGFELGGFENAGFVEFWPIAIETFKENFKRSPQIGKDIVDVKDKVLKKFAGKVDVIIGGPPCQGFSMAGKRDPKDPRNSLFMEFVRFVEIIRPKVFVMENVSGIISMKTSSGDYVLNIIIKEFDKRGYEIRAKVLNSVNYGVPQERKRIIIIGKEKNNSKIKEICYPEFKGKIARLSSVLNLPYKEIKEIQHVYSKATRKNLIRYAQVKPGQVFRKFKSAGIKLRMDMPSCTITKSGRYVHPIYNRYCSIREVARIQTFSDDFVFKGSIDDMYGQIGNAVPVLMAKAIAEVIKKGMLDL